MAKINQAAVNKATNNDKRRYIRNALKSGYMDDFDEEYVYYYEWDGQSEILMRAPYTLDGITATVDHTQATQAEYETVGIEKKSLETAVTSILNKFFSDKSKPVIKKYNDEDLTVIEPLYVAYGVVDAHKETYKSKDSVYQLCESISSAAEQKTLKSSFFHTHETDTFKLVKAWVNEEEVAMGDSVIPELQPLAEIKFKSKEAFELRKSMDLLGLSIGAKAKKEEDEGGLIKFLYDFNFDWTGAHIAYTDITDGGAASLNNDFYYTSKSLAGVKLSDKQQEILNAVGEEYTPLDKSVASAPSSVGEDSTGEDTLKTQNGKEEMTETEEAQAKEIADLRKSLTAQLRKTANTELGALGVAGDDLKAVTSIYLDLDSEQQEALVSAFKSVANSSEEELKKAKDEIATLKKGKLPEASTDTEQGHEESQDDGDTEDVSLKARVQRSREAKRGDK